MLRQMQIYWHLLSGANKKKTQLLNTPLNQINWLVLDLELTGLDPAKDHILSVGWLTAKGFAIDVNSCHHSLINTDADLNQTPVIHGIVESDLLQGETLTEALAILPEMAETHVWVLHHHGLDWQIIKHQLNIMKTACPSPLILDTLLLEKYLIEHAAYAHHKPDLTSTRERYNLPPVPAHNALEDAFATIQLLFAQLSKMSVDGKRPIHQLKYTGALLSG